jgi:hypothetical protein
LEAKSVQTKKYLGQGRIDEKRSKKLIGCGKQKRIAPKASETFLGVQLDCSRGIHEVWNQSRIKRRRGSRFGLRKDLQSNVKSGVGQKENGLKRRRTWVTGCEIQNGQRRKRRSEPSLSKSQGQGIVLDGRGASVGWVCIKIESF